MRIDTATLPSAARENSRTLKADRPFPGKAAGKTDETTTAKQAETENIAAKATPGEKTKSAESAQKLTPAGLLAAQARFQAMNPSEMNQGQSQALASISRNIARYQANQPAPTADPTPVAPTAGPTTASTEENAPATGVDISV